MTLNITYGCEGGGNKKRGRANVPRGWLYFEGLKGKKMEKIRGMVGHNFFETYTVIDRERPTKRRSEEKKRQFPRGVLEIRRFPFN